MSEASSFVTRPSFHAPYAEDDSTIARRLLASLEPEGAQAEAIDSLAQDLISAIRAKTGHGFSIETLLHEYSLSTPEGLALMALAEALLRVPDNATADQLIADTLARGNFAHHASHTPSSLIASASWALGLASRVLSVSEAPETLLAQTARRLGLPTLRLALTKAIQLMGEQFVLGQTMEQAIARAHKTPHVTWSFDCLGEGARTASDAKRYGEAYAKAIETVGSSADLAHAGVSVKLSALHPRYEALNRKAVLKELVPKVVELARLAKANNIFLTIDAEEADRLELSLEVTARVVSDPGLDDWEGFGLAVQAYQKRSPAVIDWVNDLALSLNRRFTLRLVKGAYWDTEIKRAQERGLDDYPVFTRKAMTDLNYLACADKLLALRQRLFPQFATHNALTIATIIAKAGGTEDYEFQRLHGMGETLYERLYELHADAKVRVYAPVGGHRDLLAYLVRRLLENGANSSFVALASDPDVPIKTLLQRPQDVIGKADWARHPDISLPQNLLAPRRNSKGVELGHRASLDALLNEIEEARRTAVHAQSANVEDKGSEEAVRIALKAFPVWNALHVDKRASILEAVADRLEERRGEFLALLQDEGGKTLEDALSEWREAIDFCRYYAQEARHLLQPASLPGPTGESNVLSLSGRGVFLAISPWNFPLAIFTGQVVAALVTGNSVVAKPAEQTPKIAAAMVSLLHEAGVPHEALQLLLGDGTIGAQLVADPHISGVVFTGSQEVARVINRTLAAKDGPIVPLIAETGGINAMIVDATALPEQVTDDVLTSAFRSAGQRCSALRLLCLQEDVADPIISMIAEAAKELRLGDPRDPSTHIGPVIDEEAKAGLDTHIARMKQTARVHLEGMALGGLFVAPHIFELNHVDELTHEVFGPILHVVRYRASELDHLLHAIAAKGYGLTLGIHSRIESMVKRVANAIPAGNIYVNRSMIGAVVGVQPFGGTGLSGTGPKAGGPHYLSRFVTERTLTINTTAAGGNATLLASGAS